MTPSQRLTLPRVRFRVDGVVSTLCSRGGFLWAFDRLLSWAPSWFAAMVCGSLDQTLARLVRGGLGHVCIGGHHRKSSSGMHVFSGS